MRAAAAVAVVVVVVAAAGGCPGPPPNPRDPVQLSLQIATRQSCGTLSGLDYDTSCLAAVDVVVKDADTRQPIKAVCRPQSNANSLGDLLARGDLVDVPGLSAKGRVIFEVHGLHNAIQPPKQDPCQDAELPDRWLFWGDSDVVDLGGYDVGVDGGPAPSKIIQIVIDCRDCTHACAANPDDTCFGCFFSDQCTAEMPTSYCVPTLTCDKGCTDRDECFGGLRDCVDNHCAVVQDGQLCSPCGGASAIACADQLVCVKRAGGEGFCAPDCRSTDCVSGTKCNRLHNNLEVVP